MATFDYKGNHFYIDGRLKRELDEKIFPDLQKKDKDIVFVVDGKERAGKSVFAMQLAGYASMIMGSEFDLSNICMQPDEFRQKIENSSKNQVVIYDEAHRGMASSRALSEVNKILKDLMMEMGQKNLFVIIILPTFFLLDKYAALFRATGLFHIYERRRKRGFWVYFNEKNKKYLYMKGKKEFNYDCVRHPHFRGRFLNKYTLDEKGYREKKAQSFRSNVNITQQDKFKDQRDTLIYILHEKLGFGKTNMAKLMKEYQVPLKATVLWEIIAKKGGGGGTGAN